ncbi:BTB/POZ domain, partial [Dillenia turbinata]
MRCLSCREDYDSDDAGTCKECYFKANRKIDDLKSKVAFLRFSPSPYPSPSPCFSDVVLVASHDACDQTDLGPPVPIHAHKAVLHNARHLLDAALSLIVGNMDKLTKLAEYKELKEKDPQLVFEIYEAYVSKQEEIAAAALEEKKNANCSPVFRAMFENQREEGLSGTIKICDVSHDALYAFVSNLYTAEASLDDQMARELLVMTKNYQVKHLKAYCEKFIVSKLNRGNSLLSYAFANQHNAKHLLNAALSLIVDNMNKLTKLEEYKELKEKDPQL